jgi:hypothetical protein
MEIPVHQREFGTFVSSQATDEDAGLEVLSILLTEHLIQ